MMESMENTSYLELSESALAANLKFIRKTFCKSAKLSCVVKGNAYGHGIFETAPLLVKHGVEHISVFSSYEAFQVQKAVGSGKISIMIMGDVPDYHMDPVIENEMEFFIFDLYRLKLAIERAKILNKKAKIHIEVETGMNRLGFNMKSLKQALNLIKKNIEHLSVEGVCTHFAGAESISNHTRVKEQIKNFKKALKFVSEEEVKPKLRHCACSAAALRFPKTRMDMVRVGIMTYGFWPSEETLITYLSGKKSDKNPLQTILSWKSRIMALKEVKVGEFIGYGTSYLASENKRLALIPVGYANGFARSLSNSGRVIIGGRRTQVVGTVNMNAITVDVTNFDEVNIGDEVVLIGKSKDAEITVASFANFTDQLNYEVLARLPKDLSRRVVD